MLFLTGFIFVFILSIFFTDLVRKYALKNEMLDIPNARSSHIEATPRGGGLGFVAVFLFSVVILSIFKYIPLSVVLAIGGGGILIAFIGWLDDKKGLSAKTRFVFHLIAAIWALVWLGGLAFLDLGFKSLYLSGSGWIIGALGIVWMINLYNFMDGIDGLAGTEAVIVSGIAAILLFITGAIDIAIICGLLAVSVLGFLIWNWAPAKIFMGDIGSGFLGYVLAVLAISTEQSGIMPLLVWALLLGVFLVDATVTLLRRLMQGEKWYEAHRTHVYQLAVQAGYTHRQVTLSIVLINLLLVIFAIISFIKTQWMFTIAISLMIVLIIAHKFLYNRFSLVIEDLNNKKSIAIEINGYSEVASAIDSE